MKKLAWLLVLMFLFAFNAEAQKAPYKVVFDVTSSDTVVHQMVIRWINEITAFDPSAQIEVVFYAKSLGMITRGQSTVESDVLRFASASNISFKVCQVAMKNNKVEPGQLLAGVTTVPDGIYEIIQRQYDGWGYIKASR